MDHQLSAMLEAVLFSCGRALSVKRLASLAERTVEEVAVTLDAMALRLKESGSGLRLLRHADEAELVSASEAAEIVRKAVHAETQGELSRPSLETLAVLAYRGPLTRPELEQIRGVQSSLILRNLQMRGMVDMKEETRLGQPTYAITPELLKHLGIDRAESLPDYDELHHVSVVEQALRDLEAVAPEKAKEASSPLAI